MKKKMIARVIERLEEYLTRNKEYEVLEEDEYMILIVDNTGKEFWYNKKRFEEKQEN